MEKEPVDIKAGSFIVEKCCSRYHFSRD